jgi:hypothetical protein
MLILRSTIQSTYLRGGNLIKKGKDGEDDTLAHFVIKSGSYFIFCFLRPIHPSSSTATDEANNDLGVKL